ncbi:hypothetical protein [Sphingomonas sp.]|uniref:hypothetical protein n=1 Tax=Sphingomonas sp. TaxID=28214 RepID=UPI002EDA8CDF
MRSGRMDSPAPRRSKAMWIIPVIVVGIVVVIFVGYNIVYLKQDVQRERTGNSSELAQPDAPG